MWIRLSDSFLVDRGTITAASVDRTEDKVMRKKYPWELMILYHDDAKHHIFCSLREEAVSLLDKLDVD